MDLFRKVRTLLGALAHKPFTPRPEPAAPREEGSGEAARPRDALAAPAPGEPADQARVADLLARQKDGA